MPVFLTLVGRQTYTLLRDLLSPAKPAEKTLKQLMDALRGHYEPKKVVMAERFVFHQHKQEAGETVTGFEAELRKLASRCELGETLEEAFRDRLVCGLREEVYRKPLLAEPDLTLSKALAIAQSLELADQNAKALIHQVSQSRGHRKGQAQFRSCSKPQTHGKECYRCGGTDHLAATCRFVEAICHCCKKKGHLARVCHSAKPGGDQRGFRAPGSKAQRVATVDASEDVLPMFRLGSKRTDPIVVEVNMSGVPVSMEVDTGAAVSVMSQEQQQELFPAAQLQPTQFTLRTYTAVRVEVYPYVRTPLSVWR